ncbi:Fatty-acid-binding protein 3 [Raphanus sativus]|uniref:Chalcone-flavonone isomerase family protein n=1 Tax=Raphanus sativus TaxID=3726 RepID=A0A6J0P4L2_RAPSA|nr:fatty-acid-binding protein 3, chloroplastic [Raphanus sativus]KAJ4917915.1 Fatty-acid-binding protein 3 [Raphanus sativus]
MDGVVLTAFPSVIRGLSLRSVCLNRVSAGSRHQSPDPVSVLPTVNCVSSLSIHPSKKGSSFLRKRHCVETSRMVVKSAASSVGNADESVEEPGTSVKFQRSVALPGCSTTLSLLGTGFREKKFAIIGVKVYAAGLYVDESILSGLIPWKGKSADEIQRDSSLFSSIFQDQAEKSLQIVLVRDVDGKTFWDALDEAISPRIKSPTSDDKTALSTFQGIFQNRPLNKGSVILLTWINPSKMLVSVSSGGLPKDVDAEIESGSVTSALFDVFFGDSPVSPTLKSSVANQLAMVLK